jgi:hypothetical protein
MPPANDSRKSDRLAKTNPSHHDVGLHDAGICVDTDLNDPTSAYHKFKDDNSVNSESCYSKCSAFKEWFDATDDRDSLDKPIDEVNVPSQVKITMNIPSNDVRFDTTFPCMERSMI